MINPMTFLHHKNNLKLQNHLFKKERKFSENINHQNSQEYSFSDSKITIWKDKLDEISASEPYIQKNKKLKEAANRTANSPNLSKDSNKYLYK